MDAPGWLAPATGIVALTSAAGMVGLHTYGRSLPEEHRATVRAELAADPEVAKALLGDLKRRTEWRPNVVRVGRVDDSGGRPMWRELDGSDDRFDFVVLAQEPGRLHLAVARPDDIGMYAEWTWTVDAKGPALTEVTVSEVGRIENLLVRGWWALTVGPTGSIAPDLEAFGRALGADVIVEEVR